MASSAHALCLGATAGTRGAGGRHCGRAAGSRPASTRDVTVAAATPSGGAGSALSVAEAMSSRMAAFARRATHQVHGDGRSDSFRSATQLASAFAQVETVTAGPAERAAPRWEVSLAADGDAMTVPQVVATRSSGGAGSRNGDGASSPAVWDDDYSHLGTEPPRHAQHKAASRGAVLAWAAAAAVDGTGAAVSSRGDAVAAAAAPEPHLAPRLSSADMTATRARYDALLALHPGHPLLLRNYARFLIDVCDDAVSAAPMLAAACAARDANEEWGGEEEFDGTACGMSGVLLATTARNVWVATRDGPAASRLFDAALQVAPNDCYVLAAYTAFLWQWEDHSCVSGPCGSDWGSSEATPAAHYETGAPSFGDVNNWAR